MLGSEIEGAGFVISSCHKFVVIVSFTTILVLIILHFIVVFPFSLSK
jgi:hypothetical protein